MTRWTRAPQVKQCGGCNAFVPKGAPLLELTLTFDTGTGPVRVVKVRCGACAGPVPPDLPTEVERTDARPLPSLFHSAQEVFSRIHKQRALDYTAGERQPGEDG